MRLDIVKVLGIGFLILVLSVLSCDNTQEDDGAGAYVTAERGISVGLDGQGAVPTHSYIDINVPTAPQTETFTIHNNGEITMGFWGINDITDPDRANYHDGAISINYANLTDSFEIPPGGTYSFTVTVAGTATTGFYDIAIGITNKNDVTPNPYILNLRFNVY